MEDKLIVKVGHFSAFVICELINTPRDLMGDYILSKVSMADGSSFDILSDTQPELLSSRLYVHGDETRTGIIKLVRQVSSEEETISIVDAIRRGIRQVNNTIEDKSEFSYIPMEIVK